MLTSLPSGHTPAAPPKLICDATEHNKNAPAAAKLDTALARA